MHARIDISTHTHTSANVSGPTLDQDSTQRLECSSFLVMTYFLLRDYNILPKKELHSSLWVLFSCMGHSSVFFALPASKILDVVCSGDAFWAELRGRRPA